MPRRNHKKSRNGCFECKRRHVKCDERRPICANCTTSERECQYLSSSKFLVARSISPAFSATPIGSASPAAESPRAASGDLPVNMLHVELLHNLYTRTQATFDPTRSISWLGEIVSHSITVPYLVNAMLAFSALHLSTLHQDKRDFYYYHAAQLQTHALTIFKETNAEVTEETCIPLFLFSSVLGVHMLCDTMIYRGNNFDNFLTRFVHYFHLHRGVRTIVGEAWFMLNDSIVKPAFDIGKALYTSDGHLGPVCENLLNLISSAKLGTELTAIYRQAIQYLQSCYNVASRDDNQHAGINGAVAWPILVKLEFSDLLQQRRPEALIILAYYATLLHRFRDSWLFGDSGRAPADSTASAMSQAYNGWATEQRYTDAPNNALPTRNSSTRSS
ncbi:hypothetical protein UA08_07397 [Talaromyces atroroseus]|uniref:Zn(2)-C6 fungal-type domain-containing protein n=1 Tax=Talaromyces atroroseus TaxID=1441469 RepID=A0A225AQ35_TALAT|nr:hypothetical protein UA08_07397 [Talaromyces atroroseus]OKL57056.1 hypothetical protein UA08_07397 [Talaromyces atroroseus]